MAPKTSVYKACRFADCDRLSGDQWTRSLLGDKSDLDELKDKKIHLRLHMARTHLFALSLRAIRPTNP